MAVVLGRRPDHRRAADVDLLGDVGVGGIGVGHRLPKGVEVDHHELEGLDLPLGQIPPVGLMVHPGQDSPMYHRMESLDTATKHLGRAGDIRDAGHRQSPVLQESGSSTRGDEFHARTNKSLAKLDQPGLVVDAHKSPAHHKLAHCTPTESLPTMNSTTA